MDQTNSRKMKTWHVLADEINRWALENYTRPDEPWELVMGVLEEIGEFVEARDRNDRDAVMDSFGDQAIFALNLCKTLELPVFLDDITAPGPPGLRTATMTPWVKTVTPTELLKAIGLGSKGLLKNSKGIRGMDREKMREHVGVFVSTWKVWASQQLELYAMPTLLEITNDVWDRVSTRNWKTNPLTGVASEK